MTLLAYQSKPPPGAIPGVVFQTSSRRGMFGKPFSNIATRPGRCIVAS